MSLRKCLIAASVSLAAMISTAPAVFAQEAILVFSSSEVGQPFYNPVKATLLNVASSLIFDRLVAQDASRNLRCP